MSTKKSFEFDTPEPRFHGEVTEKSHKNMSRIHGKDTSIEVRLRKALWHKGFRYRKNYKKIPGRPDIAITKYKIAIFCDSEFFHGKYWDDSLHAQILRGSNAEFWEKKIIRNMERDREINAELSALGWTVLRFWGKEIKKDLDRCVEIVEASVKERK